MQVGTINTQSILQRQSTQADDTAKLAQVFHDIVKNGGEIARDPSSGSYYMRATIQMSAADGQSVVQVDAALAHAILDCLKTGGRISRPEVISPIMVRITDAGRYGAGEAVLARLLLSACDDRKTVMLNGDRIHITDAAEKTLNHELCSFWGRLGARARWGSDDPGIEPKQGPQMQSGAGFDVTQCW
jgi:hypothetical protein